MAQQEPIRRYYTQRGDPRKRQYYITVENTQKLIEAAPNWVWRTIIALGRYGGLRSPSEVLSLPWENVDWEHGAIKVIAPKTNNTRIVPIFDELRPYLDEAWEMAALGQTHVIPEDLYLPAANGPRGWNGCNLRTTLSKIIDRAGLEPWPRPLHNLRASCESDLAREYPITTVCKWIGNTVSIAARHYVQVTDSDFRKAANKGRPKPQISARQSDQTVPAKGCHNTSEGMSNPQQPRNAKSRKVVTDNILRLLADFGCKSFTTKGLQRVAAQGFEPRTRGL